MSGFEALGAAAAVLQLVELCVKCSRTTAQIIRSYRDAPKEIKDLAIKVEMLRFRIEQVQKIGNDLSSTEMDDLLPEIHREILLEQLEDHYQALIGIHGMSTGKGGQTKGQKLQWTLIDKRKTSRIMQDLAEIHQTLDQVLSIVTVRLATVQQSSLAALRVSNAAFLPALSLQTQEIQSTIQAASERQAIYMQQTRTELVRYFEGNAEPKQHRSGQQIKEATLSVARWQPTCRPVDDIITAKDPGHDYVDDLIHLCNLETNQTLHYSNWRFGAAADSSTMYPHTTSEESRHSGCVSVKLTQYHRDFRASLRVRFFFLNQRVLSLELGLRQFTRAWTAMSMSDCRIRVVNVRPMNSPIFDLCRIADLKGVKKMLEDGHASVYDVDDGRNAGLLEYAMVDSYLDNGRSYSVRRLMLIHYLIQQGCNSVAFGGDVRYQRAPFWPAIVYALFRGDTGVLRLMLQHGLAFDLPEPYDNPVEYICDRSQRAFREQLALLGSLGFLNPSATNTDHHDSVLDGAISTRSIPDIIYAIEVLGVDLSSSGGPGRSEITASLSVSDSVAIAAVISEYGHDPVSPESIFSVSIDSGLSHWFLLAIEPHDTANASLWEVFYGIHNVKSAWVFEPVVAIFRHLLLHGSRIFEVSTNRVFEELYGYENDDHFKAEELARGWSYYDFRERRDESPWTYTRESFIENFSIWEYLRTPRTHIKWTRDGRIDKVECEDSKPAENCSFCVPQKEALTDDEESEDYEESEEHESWSEDVHLQRDSGLFASIISTKEGRRHIERFPLLKAFCYALQLAGYRAEMDDEGDVWYEDDDWDQYFDTVEHPSDLDKTGPFGGGTCEMCRNPEKYGLGYVLEEAEKGLEEWQRERQKFVDRGVLGAKEYVWPSWTRRGGRLMPLESEEVLPAEH